MTQQDQEQRQAECEWAIKQLVLHCVPAQVISIVAYECGFNRRDVEQIIQSIKEAA